MHIIRYDELAQHKINNNCTRQTQNYFVSERRRERKRAARKKCKIAQ